jgi:MFS family permease
LYAACLACSFGVFVPFVHLVPYARAHGLERPAAVLLIGIIGIGSTLGRFCLGGLADRMGRQAFLVGMYVGMALALAVWVGATGFWTLALFATLFGLFYGGWVAILPAVVADRFGTRSASGIIGVLYTSVAVGTLIGPSATGYVFDTSHSYTLPIIASAGANVCAAVITAFMSRVPAAAGEKPGRS